MKCDCRLALLMSADWGSTSINRDGGDRGWPSAFGGIGATPPVHLQMEENLKPVEENGFIIADFTTSGITIRFFRFNYHRQSPDEIDTLEPFVLPN